MHELRICGAASQAQEREAEGERDEAAASSPPAPAPLPLYLRPPPRVDGAEWGLGTEAAANVDQELVERVEYLMELKRKNGIHFNASLARNREFHNPSIYEKLVKWAGLEETGTNHTLAGTAWDPHVPQVLASGNAPRLAAQQQRYMDEREKRRPRRIDFTRTKHAK